MANLTATEANLLALPLALGLMDDTPPAPQVGDTIINTRRHPRTGVVLQEFIGTITHTNGPKAYGANGYLGRLNGRHGWTTYVTKHAEPLPYGVF